MGTQDRLLLPAPDADLTPVATPVVYRPSIFREQREYLELPAGLTVAEQLEILIPDAGMRQFANVSLDGHHLYPEHYRRIRLKPGHQLTVVLVPADSGALRIVLILAIVVAAAFAAPYLIPYVGAAGAAAITAGLSTAAIMAVNALIPPETPGLDGSDSSASDTYSSLSGSRNVAAKWRPVPILLGQMRVYPPLAAEVVTDPRGTRVFLMMAVVWNQGYTLLSDLRLGETPLGQYEEVTHTFLDANPAAAPVFPNYKNDIHQENIGARLRQGQPLTRNTIERVTYIAVEIFFPKGLMHYGKNTQDQIGSAVQIKVEYRLFGSSDAFTVHGTITLQDKTTAAVRKVIGFGVAEGQYEVKVTRVTANADDTLTLDETWWGILRQWRNTPPVLATNVACSELIIRATDQLQGTVDTFNGIATLVCLDWDVGSGLWVARATSNPASLFLYLLTHPSQPRSYTIDASLYDNVDMLKLQEWHGYCVANGYTCNLYVDWPATLDEILDIVAACGRGAKVWRDGKRSVIWDAPQTTYWQRFTPRNVRNFECTRTYMPELHGYRMKFRNQEKDYQQDEIIVYFDGYNESNASLFEELEATGITHWFYAWHYGRFMYAQWKLRPETYKFTTDWEWLACARGDMAELQHDTIVVGIGQARIRAVYRDPDQGNAIFALDLDDRIDLDPSKPYSAILQRSTGTRYVFPINNTGIATRQIRPNPFLPSNTEIAAGDLLMVGETGIETMPVLIKEIIPQGDLAALVTCIPAKWVDVAQPIPDFDSRINERPGLNGPIVLGVRSDDTVAARGPDGSIRVRIIVSIYSDGTRTIGRIAAVQLSYRGGTGTPTDSPMAYINYPADASDLAIPDVEVGASYAIRVRYVYSDGKASPWTSAVYHTVVGPNLPPNGVFAMFYDGLLVRWDHTPEPDHDGYVVRWSPVTTSTWDQAENVSDTIIYDRFIAGAELPVGTRLVMVKSITKSGILAATEGRLEVNITEADQRVLLDELNIGVNGWQGTIVGGERIAGELRAIDNSVWLEARGARWLTPAEGVWLDPDWSDLIFTFSTRISRKSKASDRMRLRWEGNGTILVDYRWGALNVITTPFADPLPDTILLGDWNDPLGSSDYSNQLGVWKPWRQGLPPMPGGLLQLRFTIPAQGDLQPILRSAILTFDGEEIVEPFTNVAIPAENTFRLDTQREWRVISYVIGTVADGGAGKWLIIDDRERSGPRVHIEDLNGVRVAGTADVTIGGS